MENVGPTQARFSMPHGILLLSFKVHKKYNVIGMIWKVNVFNMNQLRLNWSGRVTPMGEEEAFWS